MEDLDLYDLESYLFGTVRERFHREGSLGAFDLMCVVSWKANRAKSVMATRLLAAKGHGTLEEASRALTAEVHAAPTPEERLRALLHGWGLRMPMATALLTVLYPDDFTVCDVRVAELVEVKVPEPTADFSKTWSAYRKFVDAVKRCAPEHLSLRDKDRHLWAKSFREQLERDIQEWDTIPTLEMPEVLEAGIGGYFGTSYSVELVGGELVYRESQHHEGLERERRVAPTPARWAKFLRSCDSLGVWDWLPHYPNPGVCDGTGWSLTVKGRTRSVVSSGDNAFPKSFGGFRSALSHLLGGLPFA